MCVLSRLQVLLWHGRYRVTDQRPEYESPTTIIYRAVDEHTLDQHNQPIRVVLKLTHNAYKYRREVRARDYLGEAFDEDYVMPHIRLHHQSEYEPLLPISPVAAAAVAADNDNDNDNASCNVDGGDDINDDSMVPIPLPDTPEGRVVSCTGSGEGECAILIAARQTAKHWLPQRLSARARERSVDPLSLLLLATNRNNTNSSNDLEEIDFDDDGWNQFVEGSVEVAVEVAPSQTAQSNLTAPNQETDIEIEKRSGSRGDSNGVVSRGSSRGGSSSNNGSGLILSKRMAQKMLMIVLPQADRTLLTALKHEHFLVRQQKQGRSKTAVATGLTGLGVGVGAGLGIDNVGRGVGVGVGTGAGTLCLTKVRTIFTQLLDATAHMHDKGYLHGDVCPMNIGESVCQTLRLS